MPVPNKIRERMVQGIKRMLPIIEQQKARDVSEADTVTIVKEVLADVFGYDKFADLTGEFSIRGTYCDLAIRIEGKVTKLIEIKAIGITLDDRHLKQAVDYGANHGVEWIILTNGIVWRLYEVIFAKPIDKRLLLELDLSSIDLRKDADLDTLYVFTKEGFAKGAHLEARDRQQATSRYMIAALLLHNDNLHAAIRRELRRVVEVLVDNDTILSVLRDEVIKRDAQDGPDAVAAAKRVNKREGRKLLKSKTAAGQRDNNDSLAAESLSEVGATDERTV